MIEQGYLYYITDLLKLLVEQLYFCFTVVTDLIYGLVIGRSELKVTRLLFSFFR